MLSNERRSSSMESAQSRIVGKRGKQGRRSHLEKQTCPRRGNSVAAKAVPSCLHTERSSQHCWRMGIASQPLTAREPIIGPLRTRQGRRRSARINLAHLFHLRLHSLAATKLHSYMTIVPATPISPEDRSTPVLKGCNNRVNRHAIIVIVSYH